MTFMFENLQVYQKAVDVADRVCTLSETFPRGYYFLVDQLNRAALSIATNLAETQEVADPFVPRQERQAKSAA